MSHVEFRDWSLIKGRGAGGWVLQNSIIFEGYLQPKGTSSIKQERPSLLFLSFDFSGVAKEIIDHDLTSRIIWTGAACP